MDSDLLGRLEQIISAPRLERYKIVSPSELDTFALYCWNIQLSEALLPSLAVFEVTLRNLVHSTLTRHTGSDSWFRTILNPKMFANVADLGGKIANRQGYQPSSDKLISEITFGFWPKLFARSYDQLWWGRPDPLLALVIPNHPNINRATRKELEIRLEYFVALRNRVMHHEAIFQGSGALNRPMLPVDLVKSRLLETLAWLSSDASLIALSVDRFDEIFQNGQTAVSLELRRLFSIAE